MQVRCRANRISAPLLSRTCVSTTYLSLEGHKIGHLFCTVIDAAHHLITVPSLLRSGMSSFLSRRYGLIASSILFGAHYLLAQYTIRRACPQSGSVSASQKKGTGTVTKNTVPNIKQETAKRVFTGCNYSINNGIMTVL